MRIDKERKVKGKKEKVEKLVRKAEHAVILGHGRSIYC